MNAVDFELPRYSGDLSRADFAYAIYAVANGVSNAELEKAILNPDVIKKGNRVVQRCYARYAVHRAGKRTTLSSS